MMDNLSYGMNRRCLFLPVADYQKFISRLSDVLYRMNPNEKLNALSRRRKMIGLTPVLPSELILS